ncbi:unnamed protein product [Paramecium pentaurelia]|uniref:Uncharacterized protein n=1 Tax=Paramecium pentaurelia TaxID=43138 RepID=A0A8S1YKR8_9CILI|nr:unnamed protein product [Paramecium pentaurelia]
MRRINQKLLRFKKIKKKRNCRSKQNGIRISGCLQTS